LTGTLHVFRLFPIERIARIPVPLTSQTRAAVDAWLADDIDDASRDELRALLAAGTPEAEAELHDRFAGTLEFGTAGLRGVIAAGPNRFNRVVVARTTAGLCDYLARTVPDARSRGIVIGYDGRRLSRESATDAAEIVAGAGFRALVFDDVAPTPICAFAVIDRRAAAGIMITASHNPPEYNGYKVYWGNGAQIIPPHDEGIARSIAAVGPSRDIPRTPAARAREDGLFESLGADLEQRYLEGVVALCPHRELPRRVRIAYTALHGVGERLARAALQRAGFEHVESVAEQAAPDGGFPTVAFPNPEEKGAMDRVLELAERSAADLVLANDPDADRLAVAVRARDGSLLRFSGNELGALLAHYLLSEGTQEKDRVVMCSIVSSPMLADIARQHGAHFEHTLTGFKWLANRALDFERDGTGHFVFAFEEALGYTAGALVRDKDGISTAVLTADMAAWCAAQGRMLDEELERVWRRYGLWLSHQVSVTLRGQEGAERIARTMDAMRRSRPTRFGDTNIEALQDIRAGERYAGNSAPSKLTLPRSNVLLFELSGGHRIMMRPSGTEPKIKYYFDVREMIGAGEPLAQARDRAEQRLKALVDAFLAAIEQAG
jgi:phosphomannomutase